MWPPFVRSLSVFRRGEPLFLLSFIGQSIRLFNSPYMRHGHGRGRTHELSAELIQLFVLGQSTLIYMGCPSVCSTVRSSNLLESDGSKVHTRRAAKHAIAVVTRFDTAPLKENKPNDISLTLSLSLPSTASG